MKILDATCGPRGIWFNKKHPDATYIDINPIVNPDFVMDCRKTNFPDNNFDMIVFDPPHVNMGAKSEMGERYGHFTTQEIRNIIQGAFTEFYRILKDEGFVLFKWNDHNQKLDRILLLVKGFEPLFGQKVAIKTKHSSATYWVCFRKRLNQVEKPLEAFA